MFSQLSGDSCSILKRLNAGRFGEIYEGKLKQKGKEQLSVAVKIAPNDDQQEEFSNEIAIVQAIPAHENIIRYYGLCRLKSGRTGLVMELMIAGNLCQLISGVAGGDVPAISDKIFLTLMLCVARGLAHLHSHLILHNDIKSTNVLVNNRVAPTLAKLCDFGKSTSVYSGNGSTRGTDGYDAPEKLANGSTRQTDMFAFGVTCHNGQFLLAAQLSSHFDFFQTMMSLEPEARPTATAVVKTFEAAIPTLK